jgi:hypothetical protein
VPIRDIIRKAKPQIAQARSTHAEIASQSPQNPSKFGREKDFRPQDETIWMAAVRLLFKDAISRD